MHARLTTVTGASEIDKGLAYLRDSVVPQVQQQKGFRGLTASADRSTGLVLVLALWDSEADLDASESVADKARGESLKVLGGQARVDRFEQAIWEVGQAAPQPGAKLHVRPVKMESSRVDENLAYFKETVLPEIKGTPGFMSVRLLINRMTGEGRVGTLWADASTLEGARAKSEERRSTAAGRGVEFGEDMVLELVLAAL
jgi:heme-degrading monooxygenase HmoA